MSLANQNKGSNTFSINFRYLLDFLCITKRLLLKAVFISTLKSKYSSQFSSVIDKLSCSYFIMTNPGRYNKLSVDIIQFSGVTISTTSSDKISLLLLLYLPSFFSYLQFIYVFLYWLF